MTDDGRQVMARRGKITCRQHSRVVWLYTVLLNISTYKV